MALAQIGTCHLQTITTAFMLFFWGETINNKALGGNSGYTIREPKPAFQYPNLPLTDVRGKESLTLLRAACGCLMAKYSIFSK